MLFDLAMAMTGVVVLIGNESAMQMWASSVWVLMSFTCPIGLLSALTIFIGPFLLAAAVRAVLVLLTATIVGLGCLILDAATSAMSSLQDDKTTSTKNKRVLLTTIQTSMMALRGQTGRIQRHCKRISDSLEWTMDLVLFAAATVALVTFVVYLTIPLPTDSSAVRAVWRLLTIQYLPAVTFYPWTGNVFVATRTSARRILANAFDSLCAWILQSETIIGNLLRLNAKLETPGPKPTSKTYSDI